MSTAIKNAELVKLPIEELRVRARDLKIEVSGDEDVAELVGLIIANTVAAPGELAKPGVLVSIHTGNQACRDFVLRARNVIATNEKGGFNQRCFLQNKEGSAYTKNYPGVVLTEKTFKEMLNIGCLSPLPDGSQAQLLTDLTDKFDSFEKVLLVRVGRMQIVDGKKLFNQFVMLYAEVRQEVIEQAI